MDGRASFPSAVLWLVLAAAAAVRVPLWLINHGSPEIFYRNDSAEYLSLAANLMDHGVFSSSPSPPWVANIRRTPGYPALIVLVSSPFGGVMPAAVILFQLLLGAMAAVLTSLLTHRITGKRRAAAGAGLLVAFDLAFLESNFTLLTDTPFTFLLLCTLLIPHLSPRLSSLAGCLLTGVLLSLATMIRPIGLYLGALAALTQRRLPRALALLALSAVLPAFWCARNHKELGVWALTDILSRASLSRAASIESLGTGTPLHEQLAILDRQLEESESSTGRRKSAKTLTWEIAVRKPVLLAKNLAIDSTRLLSGISLYNLAHLASTRPYSRTEVTPLEKQRRAGDWIGPPSRFILDRYPALWLLAAFHIFHMSALYACALLGARALWVKAEYRECAALCLPAAYLLSVSVMFGGGYRLRVPVLPCLAVLAGIGLGQPRRVDDHNA